MKLRHKLGIGLLGFVVVGVVALAMVLSYEAECGPVPPVPDGVETMRAVVYRCYGPPEVLQLERVEKPEPAAGQVRVRVRAASVNPYDWHFMRGSPYFMRLMSGIGRPEINRLGVDFAGVVEAVGEDVTRFAPGDEVFGARTGAFAEYVVLGEDRIIVPKPGNVSFEQAAAVPIAGVTALQALRDKGGLQAGQSVLINGASGGVGTFAVQIAKAYGAEVTGVCSTRNLEMVRSLGADRVIDYTREDYTEGDQRWDLIVDMVGNHSPLENRRVLVPGGTLVLVGAPKGDWVAPLAGMAQALVIGPFVDERIEPILAEFNVEDMDTLAGLMASGRVTPVIDRVFDLEALSEAMRYSEAGHARGKIIVRAD